MRHALSFLPAAPGKVGAQPEGLLATLARLVAERDTSLRSAALGGLEVAYAFEGEGAWGVACT